MKQTTNKQNPFSMIHRKEIKINISKHKAITELSLGRKIRVVVVVFFLLTVSMFQILDGIGCIY